MKKVFMIIAAMCMTSIMASAQKTIRVSTDKTDLVMQVSPKGRLYQVYLGDKLKNPSDYNHLKWDVYAASDGSVCQRGHEVYATSGAEDFFEPAVAVTHADGNMLVGSLSWCSRTVSCLVSLTRLMVCFVTCKSFTSTR